MKEIIVTDEFNKVRVDKVVFKVLKFASKGFIYKMYRKKNIVLNDKKITGKEEVIKGDSIKFYFHDDTFDKFSKGDGMMDPMEESNLSSKDNLKKIENQEGHTLDKAYILYEDHDLLVYNKPVGILSQPNGRDDNLIFRYKKYLEDQGIEEGLLDTYGVCNRLDRNTTGVILLGKNPKSLRIINNAITNKEVTKTYHAIVKGHVKKELDLKAHLTKKQNRNRVTISSNGIGDYIHTKVKPLKVSQDKSYSLVQVTILTGKSHQIRAHLSSIGYPLIGDGKYGDKKTNDYFRKNNNIKYQMLHSYLYKIELDKSILPCFDREYVAPYFDEMGNLIKLLFK